MTTDATSIITAISTVVTGIAGMIIAILLYRLSKYQREESWVKVYMEILDSFWNDPVMARVRYWINYDKAYLELNPVLHKRREIDEKKKSPQELDESEYMFLDDLDKFYTLALQLAAINTHLRVSFEQRFWKDLYFDYWILGCLKEGRTELKWYVERFYPELLNPDLPVEKARSEETGKLRRQAKRVT